MPNQRAKNKIQLGGFVEKRLHRQITRLAKQAGMEFNRFGFVQQLIQEALASRSKKHARVKARRTYQKL